MKFATITTTLCTILLASVTTVASTNAASDGYVPPATPNPYATCCKNNNGTYIIFSEPDGEYGFCKTYNSDVWYKAASFTQEHFFYDENCNNEKAKTNQLA
ncbi:hypothetical protein FRACYDRAFT_254193 [Fragilariopsis cylindrus CCMP1102]|uniref:Uncharacterized protein n=1 Tax=Fragilariopsis cylindrus CCMP1102 TaxID=635003 RepID=A0A1E7EL51_9STRA|nr:hypothetical protein FRACYDRAFT_254193 [Fragilariopsis cylindrus CCMP1102]|eukprot:OEU06642.1 hypothetical protein FRACYDRAFT_254193 [Fragilariopsis cylindrus CCMP1102]